MAKSTKRERVPNDRRKQRTLAVIVNVNEGECFDESTAQQLAWLHPVSLGIRNFAFILRQGVVLEGMRPQALEVERIQSSESVGD